MSRENTSASGHRRSGASRAVTRTDASTHDALHKRTPAALHIPSVEPSGAIATATWPAVVGSRVILHGLRRDISLNGVVGVLHARLDVAGRPTAYYVKLANGRTVACASKHVCRIDATPMYRYARFAIAAVAAVVLIHLIS